MKKICYIIASVSLLFTISACTPANDKEVNINTNKEQIPDTIPQVDTSYLEEEINLEKYEQIKMGMTYQEVVKLLGFEGNNHLEVATITEQEQAQLKKKHEELMKQGKELYVWTGFGKKTDKGYLGSVITVAFDKETQKLTDKHQIGLLSKDDKTYWANQVNNNPRLTIEKYNQIKVGMTYQEVVKILGFEGQGIDTMPTIPADEEEKNHNRVLYTWISEGASKDMASVISVDFDKKTKKVVIKRSAGLGK